MIKKCKTCGNPFYAIPSRAYRIKYCSRACCNKAQRKGKLVKCHHCGKEIWKMPSDISRSKTKTFFCNPECRHKWGDKRMPRGEKHPSWKDGRASYRKRAFRHYGKKCMNPKCPIRKNGISVSEKMLDVDHIDGDRSNNAIKNLKVLCMWCHGLKSRKV